MIPTDDECNHKLRGGDLSMSPHLTLTLSPPIRMGAEREQPADVRYTRKPNRLLQVSEFNTQIFRRIDECNHKLRDGGFSMSPHLTLTLSPPIRMGAEREQPAGAGYTRKPNRHLQVLEFNTRFFRRILSPLPRLRQAAAGQREEGGGRRVRLSIGHSRPRCVSNSGGLCSP